MSEQKKPAWWMIPALITGSLAALGAMGTLAVNYATYAALPSKVEAVEQHNGAQDKQIDRLITLQEYYQKQDSRQSVAPSRSGGPRWRETDAHGFWCCDEERLNDCWLTDNEGRNQWWKCQ